MANVVSSRLIRGGAGVAIVSLVALAIAACGGCRDNAADNAVASQPSANIVLGPARLFRPNAGENFVYPTVVSGENGRRWLFVSVHTSDESSPKHVRLAFSYADGKTWSPFAEVAPVASARQVAAAIDNGGAPVVAWMENEPGTIKHHLFVGQWTGKGFAVKEEFQANSNDMGMNLALGRDQSGSVHLVYEAELNPPEEYVTIRVHGVSAGKLWHAALKDGTWSQAKPTTGRGKYWATYPELVTGHDGKMWLTYQVSPFSVISDEEEYVGAQMWDGQKWSSLKKISAGVKSLISYGTAIDRNSVFHVTWEPSTKSSPSIVNYNAVTSGRVSGVEGISGEGWNPVIAANGDGQVFMAWLEYGPKINPYSTPDAPMHRPEKLTVKGWNGRKWSPVTTIPVVGQSDIHLVSVGADEVCLYWVNSEGLHLQELTLAK